MTGRNAPALAARLWPSRWLTANLKYAPAPGFNGDAGYIRYRASGMMSAHHD
ncbi:hypothetical protein ACNY67_06350 [Pantoea sp. KXB45]|uniref:hypothetical protein n=1 Tax=Pantoea sp. KXB45 TaxID=3402309 RepID=UPI0025FA75F9|nr:hypothetical protein [uncultured Pantoea sp.]